MLNRFSADTGYRLTPGLLYDRTLNLALDVYQPEQASGAPVVVFFHGGRWSEGDKNQYKFVGQALASRGFVAVIPDFRQYPAVRFPAFVEDAARAVRWARNAARAYGGDPAQLFVMGHSSGAHIAALLALNEDYLKAVGGSRTWLRGMIGLAGAYDFMPITAPDLRDIFGPVEKFALSQPIYYVDGQNPPLLLIHGRDDKVVPVKNTENLARAVAKAGGPVETVIYESLSHAMVIGSLASYLRGRADVLDNIEDFIQRTVKTPQAVRRPVEIQATPLIIEDTRDLRTQELPPSPAGPIEDSGADPARPVPVAP
ncbi:Acetyl esterase/lipase [Fontimonas thermophila]|uniref:Acetyl esterase/lipase n=2 Tax=Fontimonas thermophila TaxID=1076937 RepID=A0A1I2KEN6_9GAMM|nr:Acetyl esterase/lipase [Fontimonas thermophila]